MPLRPSSLLEELRQHRPFASTQEEVVVALLRTTALLRRALEARTKRYGVSVAQYNVLRILRGAGSEGLPTLGVRDRLIEEAPGITRLIDKLQQSGLVVRERSARDRRTVHCRVTPKGLALLQSMDQDVRAMDIPVTKGLSGAEQKVLLDLLARVRAGLLANP